MRLQKKASLKKLKKNLGRIFNCLFFGKKKAKHYLKKNPGGILGVIPEKKMSQRRY